MIHKNKNTKKIEVLLSYTLNDEGKIVRIEHTHDYDEDPDSYVLESTIGVEA